MTVLYGSDVADATLTTACDMASATGGTETSKTSSGTGVNIYQEVYSKGGSPASVGAIPATPTGNGWVFKQATAGTYPLGNWSASVTFSSTFTGISLTLRFFKYSGGTYTSIGTITVSLTGSVKTTYSFAATSMPATTFGSSDLLYIDLWFLDNNSNISGDNPIIYESTSATQGVANDMQITTTTFGSGSTTSDRKFTTRLSQFSQAPKKITSRLFQFAQDSRKFTTRLSHYAKRSRIFSARLFQYLVDARKYPARLYQYAINDRKFTSRVFQFVQSTRKTTTRFFQSNRVARPWSNRLPQFAKQSRVVSTRLASILFLSADKIITSRLSQFSQAPKKISTRLLHAVIAHKIAITRFSQFGQASRKTTTRFFQLVQQNRKTPSRLFQNAKSDRVITSRFFQKGLTQVQKSITSRLFQINASGNVSDSSAPSLYYTMNGVVLDTPVSETQAPLQGGNILQGSCFILAWQYPSSATQVAMANRSTGSAQFFCNGSLVVAPVFIESALANSVLVATVRVMTTTAISTSVMQTQFY